MTNTQILKTKCQDSRVNINYPHAWQLGPLFRNGSNFSELNNFGINTKRT